jgi:hypothetical protein
MPKPSPDIITRAVGSNRLRFRRLGFVLNFLAVTIAFGVFQGPGFVPSIVPSGHDQTLYLVVNNFGNLGTAFPKTDVDKANLETTITDLMSGQHRSGGR